eukprot:Lankesteria_metandrocarpae@DN2461_c0_g1_i1.p1
MTYATIWGFNRHPEKIWELLRDFLQTSDPQPNPSHKALAALEEAGYLKCLITQNVDNLHQDAGSTDVIEFHGNLMKATCRKCSEEIQLTKLLFADREFTKHLPPKCKACGGIMKPNAVLFGEAIPAAASARANSEARKADLLLVIGTSANVTPASYIPYTAMSNGATIYEINLEETGLTNRISDFFIKTKSSRLTAVVDMLNNYEAPGVRR